MGHSFRRARRAFALFAVAAAVAVPAAFAGDSSDTASHLADSPALDAGEVRSESTGKWFVELTGSPADFRNQAKASGLKYKERFVFDKLWKGMSVSIAHGDLDQLEGVASVKALYPVFDVSLDPMRGGEQTDLATAVQTTGASAANAAGHTGEGVLVAVMDTGVDYDHADLGGCFGSGCKVSVGHDFVGNAYDANPASATYNPVPTPDPLPDDCNGHGTHVAGIVAANGSGANTVKGVAPDAEIAAYRVFGCEGSTDTDIMIAAMERALADGADVLNMSIGSAFQTWPQYPTAVAASALVDKGMVVVASIGNSGANGQYSAGAPGVGSKVIGVASFDNAIVTQFSFTITPDGKKNGYGVASGAPAPPKTGDLPMSRTGTSASTADACATPITDIAVLPPQTGKAVLIRRGTCGFYNKALAAQNAGAAAVVLYNNAAGTLTPTVAPVSPHTTPITIPVVMISMADGNAIDARLASGPVTMTWTADTVTTPSGTANRLSAFSSYGQDAELTLKPDIGAPGGDIWSTYPLEKGGYASIGGTSMSSPHVAGAAALLREARPSLAAAAFRDVLQNSSDPKNWSGNPALGFLDFSFRQGAGMVDIDDAIASTTTINPGKLSLGESEAGPQTRSLRITNSGTSAATYSLGHVNTLAASGTATPTTNPPFSFGIFTHSAAVSFSQSVVTVPAGGSANVAVTISPSATLPDRSQYGGYVTVSSGDDVFSVPYAGLKGDYQSIVALRLGLIGRVLPGGALSIPSQTDPAALTFTLQGSDVPNVMLNLGHQSRSLKLSILDAATGQPVHPEFHNFHEEEYLGRSGTANTVFVFPWNGTRLHSNGNKGKTKVVQDGKYVLVAKVLKALGDTSNPAHWETYQSPTITIDRP